MACVLVGTLLASAADVTSAASAVPAAPAAAPSADRWQWPTAPPHRILQGFEAPATPYSAGHRGIDIEAAEGETVYAPTNGVVHFAGRVVDRPVITLDVGGGLLVSFEPVDASVQLNAQAHAGEAIGTVSRGGHCSAACVHLGVRRDGEYVSPLLFLGGIERAVLLPIS